MKKLLQENLSRQYQKNEKSKEKIKNTTFSEKIDKESTHVSSVRNSSKCRNSNIANKKNLVENSPQLELIERTNPQTSCSIFKNLNQSEQKSKKTHRQIMDLSFVENQTNKLLLERYIKIKNNLYNTSNERAKTVDPSRMTLVESVNYIYSILNKDQKGESKVKCKEEINGIILQKMNTNEDIEEKIIEKKILETEKNNSIEKEKHIELIINMQRENRRLKECTDYYIRLCKELAGEIIALRNEADKYKYMVTKKNE